MAKERAEGAGVSGNSEIGRANANNVVAGSERRVKEEKRKGSANGLNWNFGSVVYATSVARGACERSDL